jgi:hypothetical protein
MPESPYGFFIRGKDGQVFYQTLLNFWSELLPYQTHPLVLAIRYKFYVLWTVGCFQWMVSWWSVNWWPLKISLRISLAQAVKALRTKSEAQSGSGSMPNVYFLILFRLYYCNFSYAWHAPYGNQLRLIGLAWVNKVFLSIYLLAWFFKL